MTTNSGPGGDGPPWWLRPQVWAAFLIVAAIGITVLLTGCGGGSGSPTAAVRGTAAAVAPLGR